MKYRIKSRLSDFCRKYNIIINKKIFTDGGSKWTLSKNGLTLFYWPETSRIYKQEWKTSEELTLLGVCDRLREIFDIGDEVDEYTKMFDYITIREMNRDGILKWENS